MLQLGRKRVHVYKEIRQCGKYHKYFLEKLKYQVFAQRSMANCPLLTPQYCLFALSASEQNLLELSYSPPQQCLKTLHVSHLPHLAKQLMTCTVGLSGCPQMATTFASIPISGRSPALSQAVSGPRDTFWRVSNEKQIKMLKKTRSLKLPAYSEVSVSPSQSQKDFFQRLILLFLFLFLN